MYDPDNNELEYSWSLYEEPSDYHGKIIFDGSNARDCQMIVPEAGASLPEGSLVVTPSGNAKIKIPEDFMSGDIHVICDTDSGDIPLTSYRRIVLHLR